LLIQGGLLALPDGDWRHGDLLVEDGVITALGDALPAGGARVVDARRG